MANGNFIHEPETLVEKALDALREHTGISGKLVALQANIGSGYTADAVVELTTGQQTHRYIAECKFRANRKSVVSHVGMTLSKLSAPSLFIAPYISREIAGFCRSINLQFIDTHGNAYLNSPGMYVHVAGQKNVADTTGPGEGRGSANPAALRVAFVLLSQPMMVRATYRDIQSSAGVSLGSVNRTFTDLKKRGLLLDPDNASQRKLLEPTRLFDEWIVNYPIVLRPQLKSKRFSAPDSSWWQKVDLAEVNAAWGGEVAAERLTGYLKPVSQTLYVEPAALNDCMKKLVSTHRLRPDPRGSIEILEKFWHFPPNPAHPDIAPAVLVYADLMATYDPRNMEAATMIRESINENADR